MTNSDDFSGISQKPDKLCENFSSQISIKVFSTNSENNLPTGSWQIIFQEFVKKPFFEIWEEKFSPKMCNKFYRDHALAQNPGKNHFFVQKIRVLGITQV